MGRAVGEHVLETDARVTSRPSECTVVWLGRVDYQEAWDLQRALANARVAGTIGDVLLLLEHPHVYTVGRRGQRSDILLDEAGLAHVGATVHHVDRGGEVTYHGPGQLVGYPIIDLRQWGDGPLRYVRTLERVLIDALSEFRIPARRSEGLTGVWVAEEKMAAIGVKVSRGVTTHGFALNVDPDLSYYRHIVPCGIVNRGVTSMARLLGRPLAVSAVWPHVVEQFGRHFGFSMVSGSLDTLQRAVGLYATPGAA